MYGSGLLLRYRRGLCIVFALIQYSDENFHRGLN